MTLCWFLSSDPRIELSIPRLKLEDPFQNSRDSLSAISLAPYSRHYLKFSQEASFQLSPARGAAVRSLISLLLLLVSHALFVQFHVEFVWIRGGRLGRKLKGANLCDILHFKLRGSTLYHCRPPPSFFNLRCILTK